MQMIKKKNNDRLSVSSNLQIVNWRCNHGQKA